MIDWLIENYAAISVWSALIGGGIGLICWIILLVMKIHSKREMQEYLKRNHLDTKK